MAESHVPEGSGKKKSEHFVVHILVLTDSKENAIGRKEVYQS
jgi:hypothetical protein